MLQVFYPDIDYVLQWFSSVFLQVFQKHVSSVSSTFRHMLQVLHLDVLKINQVLHLPRRFFYCLTSVFSLPPGAGWASSVPLLHFPMLVTFGMARKTYAGSG